MAQDSSHHKDPIQDVTLPDVNAELSQILKDYEPQLEHALVLELLAAGERTSIHTDAFLQILLPELVKRILTYKTYIILFYFHIISLLFYRLFLY